MQRLRRPFEQDAVALCWVAAGLRPPRFAASATSGMSPQIALRALAEAIDEVGNLMPASNHIPARTKTVTFEQWRNYSYRRGISASDEPRAKQQAFKRASEYLIGEEHVGAWDNQVWPAKEQARANV